MPTVAAPTLRPPQRAALEAVVTAARPGQDGRLEGQNRLLVKMPTGTGKTVTFAALRQWDAIRAWLEQFPENDRRILVIAHREELLDQAADKFHAANPGAMISIEQGDRHANRYGDVVIASIQTLQAMKFRRLKRLISQRPFRVAIVDEAHHAAASTYRSALVHLGFLPPATASESGDLEAANFDDVAMMTQALEGWDAQAPKDRLLLGFTATPNRSDAVGLGCVFQSIAFSYALKQAIDEGYLVPPVPWVIESDVNLDDVKTTAGDFNQKQLAKAVNNARRTQLAIAGWQERSYGKPTIAFTVDVAHAHAVAEAFRAVGVRAVAISGETPKEERRQMLRQYQARQIDLVANCMVLTEGTDLPLTECILHLKPTKSATLYEQMTGRGLRLWDGKTHCDVIDVVDVAKRHSLQTAPVLYGLPPSLVVDGKRLDEAVDELEALKEKHPSLNVDELLAGGRLTLAQLAARAATFDIWTVPSLGALGAALTMNWIKTGEGTFRLQYPWADGTEILVVQEDVLGHFDISVTLRPKEGGHARQRTVASQIPSALEALTLAEVFVQQERREVVRLKDRDATWRGRPASPKALRYARKLGAPVHPGMSAGEVSNLIDLAKERAAR